MENEQPAGWYPSPDPEKRASHARYWDGARWTDHEVVVADALAPAPGAPGATAAAAPVPPADEPARGGRGRRLLARTAVLLLIVAVTLPLVATWLERADARGPVVFALEDRTRWNTLLDPPELVITSGMATDRRQLTVVREGTFLVVPDLTWSLEEPLRIELVPTYETEVAGRVALDLRDNGARRLGQGWPVRVLVVATDTTFDIEISQPVVRGIRRSREVVHRSSIPRSDERRLIAAIAARDDAIAAQQACVAEQRDVLLELARPVLGLEERYRASLRRHEFGQGLTMTFEQYRANIRDLAGDMRTHLEEAERVRMGLPPEFPLREIDIALMDYAALREAWLQFERALRTPRDRPGASFRSMYPSESGAVEGLEVDFVTTAASAGAAMERAIVDVTMRGCAELHPLP